MICELGSSRPKPHLYSQKRENEEALRTPWKARTVPAAMALPLNLWHAYDCDVLPSLRVDLRLTAIVASVLVMSSFLTVFASQRVAASARFDGRTSEPNSEPGSLSPSLPNRRNAPLGWSEGGGLLGRMRAPEDMSLRVRTVLSDTLANHWDGMMLCMDSGHLLLP